MAKRFVFKLQKVLEHRERLEEDAKRALTRAQQDLEEGRGAYDRAREAVERHDHALDGKKELTENDYWLHRNYAARLVQERDRARMQTTILEQAVAAARENLAHAAKQRKVLEKLKENQADNHARQQALQEQKDNDEISTLTFRHEDL